MYGYVDSNFGQSGFYAGGLLFGASADPVITPAPEPATFGLFAGAALILFASRIVRFRAGRVR
jgi:hypothetical protein